MKLTSLIVVVTFILVSSSFSLRAQDGRVDVVEYGEFDAEFSKLLSGVDKAVDKAYVIICKGLPIPSGYVITASSTDYACPNVYIGNAHVTKIPGSPEIICPYSPFPNTYVITAVTSLGGACGSGYPTGKVIRIPGAVEIICPFSPIPAGYIQTGTTSVVGACGPGYPTGKVIRRL